MINIMRKRIICFASIIFLSVLSANIVFAIDYYVDQTGGNDLNLGTNPDSAWKTIDKVNRTAFNPDDNIYFKRGEVWEETLIVSSSGTQKRPIYFTAYGNGANPVIKCSDTFSDWKLKVDNPPIKIWEGSIPGPKSFIMGAMRNGIRRPKYFPYHVKDSKWSKPEKLSNMQDGCFLGYRKKFYFRYDEGNPGSMEIGARLYGIYIKNKSFVIIDGIDVYGPGRYLSWKKTGGAGSRQIVIDHCDNVIIKNNALSHHHWGGATIVNGSTNCLYENVTSFGHRSSGLYFWEAGEGNKAIKCEVFKCGIVSSDHGDMGLIGVFKTNGVQIENCYLHDNGHLGNPEIDAAISFAQSTSGIVTCCHIKNAGRIALQFAENSDYGMASYNIIDNWGVYAKNTMRNPSSEGIRIGGGYGSSTAKGCKIYNNLFINGGLTPGEYATLRILYRDNEGLEVKNNIFYNNVGVYEVFAQSRDGFKNWFFSNNIFYRTSGNAINWSGKCYDYRHIIGKIKGYYSCDQKQESGSIVADAKIMFDTKSLASDSPCIDTGVDVGLSVDYHGNFVPCGTAVDIGPFEYQGPRVPPSSKRLRVISHDQK